jgi:hypothetical protein
MRTFSANNLMFKILTKRLQMITNPLPPKGLKSTNPTQFFKNKNIGCYILMFLSIIIKPFK